METERDFHIDQLANSGQRFANYFIDTFAIVGLSYYLVNNITLNDPRVLYLIVFLCYYSLSEWLFGKTLGKLITKTTVIRDNGKKIYFATALIRTLIRLVPFEALSFLGKVPHGWHDKFTKTIVLPDAEL